MEPQKTTARHARAHLINRLTPRSNMTRLVVLSLTIALGALLGLDVAWLGIILAAGLAVWIAVACVESLREARQQFDEIVRPPREAAQRPRTSLAERHDGPPAPPAA